MKVAVITVSDRASAGVYADLGGPEIRRLIRESHPDCQVESAIVPDEEEMILAALEAHAGADWIITTGGTGPSPRDVTPEATRRFIERTLPGITLALTLASLAETPNAMFSRALAGQRGRCLVANFPGSVKAVRCCTRVLLPVLAHGPAMARGEGH
jgi:molybdopterin adenylyltransferase